MKANLAMLARAAWDWLLRTKTKPLLIFTAACLLIAEQYPFSNFPMYASFGSKTYYVYLTDGSDQPVRARELVGMTTPTLKKVYDGETRREAKQLRVPRGRLTAEQKRVVGERILTRLKTNARAEAAGAAFPAQLRLYHVEIELIDGRIEKKTSLIAER